MLNSDFGRNPVTDDSEFRVPNKFFPSKARNWKEVGKRFGIRYYVKESVPDNGWFSGVKEKV